MFINPSAFNLNKTHSTSRFSKDQITINVHSISRIITAKAIINDQTTSQCLIQQPKELPPKPQHIEQPLHLQPNHRVKVLPAERGMEIRQHPLMYMVAKKHRYTIFLGLLHTSIEQVDLYAEDHLYLVESWLLPHIVRI
jgi:hypothetical protein